MTNAAPSRRHLAGDSSSGGAIGCLGDKRGRGRVIIEIYCAGDCIMKSLIDKMSNISKLSGSSGKGWRMVEGSWGEEKNGQRYVKLVDTDHESERPEQDVPFRPQIKLGRLAG